jgi:gluconokinase
MNKIIIIMGVAGCGKSTIGSMLAHELGWDFYDADDFHSEANRIKMAQNIPLTDEDRASWLDSLHSLIGQNIQNEKPIVLACSALKKSYRDILGNPHNQHVAASGFTAKQSPHQDKEVASGKTPSQRHIEFIYLRGTYEQIEARLLQRSGHFMSAKMLASQFDILEEPQDALTIDITHTPQEIISAIRKGLAL